MTAQSKPEFSKWRSILLPIHNEEMKKFIPMAGVMFFILFNYTVVRNLKDTLMITGAGSGAEVLNFLKTWIVFPSSILFVVLYSKLSNNLSRQGLYYATLIPFVAFFGLFALLIYPNREFLHPDLQTITALQEAYPNFKWLFPIYGLWSYSIFYTFAELWGNVGINLLFWQFANEITRTEEAKRFYSIFGIFGNLGLIAAGQSNRLFANLSTSLQECERLGYIIDNMMFLVVLSGIGIMAVYYWMNSRVLTDPRFYEKAQAPKKKKDKPKLSIGESFKYLIHSKYLGYIALLVLGYGMTINLVEVTWKNQIKMAYPNPHEFTSFMGSFFSSVGLITIFFLYCTKNVVRRFGWYTGAMATPLMILVTCVLFFAFVLYSDSLSPLVAFLGTTPLILSVFVGAIQNMLSKGVKYALFDPTREMTYIPLDQEMKVKGKAAVDVIGGRLGKSGGGYIQQVLLIITAGSQITIAPYLGGAVIVIALAWMWAVGRLSTEYQKKLDEQEPTKKEAS